MSGIKIGLIGGTGLGQTLGALTDGIHHEPMTPFGRPSDPIIETQWEGLPLLFLSRHGTGHVYNPSQVPLPGEHLRTQAARLHAHHCQRGPWDRFATR